MRFDRFDPAFEQAEELLPDGTHECEIVKTKAWMAKDGNREALIVTLQPTAGSYGPVEKWLDPTNKNDHKAAMQLADAVGVPRDQELGENLVGRTVSIVTKRGISKKTGEPVVYINGFISSGQPVAAAPVAKPAARKASTAAKVTTNADDIPF